MYVRAGRPAFARTYTYTNICGNIVNNNDDLNERTNTLLYKKYTSHTLFERVDVGCVWEVSWRRGQTATYWPQVLLTLAALLRILAGVLNPGPLRAQALCLALALTTASCPQPPLELNWPKPSVAPGYIFVLRPPASCGVTHLHRIQPRPQVEVIFRYLRPDAPVSLFFRSFTQMHLLIDGSVEGQYVTYSGDLTMTFYALSSSWHANNRHLLWCFLSWILSFSNFQR